MAKKPPALHAWTIQHCELVKHVSTGLRFFVWDNYETREVDVASFTALADDAALKAEAEGSGYTVEEYIEFLSSSATEQAERHLARKAGRG